MTKKRNYREEYDSYQGTPEQKARRAQRNQARREAIREGRVSKGDGKHVHHPGEHRTGPLPDKTEVISKKANLKIQPKRKRK